MKRAAAAMTRPAAAMKRPVAAKPTEDWEEPPQGAQRLAQGQLEEDCAQSEGRKWFGKFDKMDNKKVVCPTIASQLATPFFKDLSLRLVTGILGSMWHGTRTCQHHIRTLFDDWRHG